MFIVANRPINCGESSLSSALRVRRHLRLKISSRARCGWPPGAGLAQRCRPPGCCKPGSASQCFAHVPGSRPTRQRVHAPGRCGWPPGAGLAQQCRPPGRYKPGPANQCSARVPGSRCQRHSEWLFGWYWIANQLLLLPPLQSLLLSNRRVKPSHSMRKDRSAVPCLGLGRQGPP